MRKADIRKIVVQIEEIHQEQGRSVSGKTKVTVVGIIRNPFAGAYQNDLEPLYDLGADISGILARRGVAALGVKPDDVTSYGKAAIVGTDGEIEHTAAILHPRFGGPVRAAVEKGDDIIPGTKKVGGPGSTAVIPLTNKNNIWEFDDMDSTEISVADAPRSDEILVAVALGIGGRPLARTKPD
ncbi:peptide synthetase [Kiloniella spongiae]|uniref:Peptide synthetase n=1 Tax=Kiloniella spongiae TaxID=1489064 RepID=A0A0H2M9H3_9PROT|nr:peptide synthetase [Kiloniella spongiae]